MNGELFKKYDVAGPRYTSYPTVPYWENTPSQETWLEDLNCAAADHALSWSLYIHLPYCESRCWFCACNSIGSRDHAVETPYLETLVNELDIYLSSVPMLAQRALKQIHLGGGTPTFFSARNLDKLFNAIKDRITFNKECFDASIEVNPCHTARDQIEVLARHGFTRISFGVQDFDSKVQEAIHRVQPLAETTRLLNLVRASGFTSVNFDLIYGLPGQTESSIAETAKRTVGYRPERIALYSFALVPWIQPVHRKFAESAPGGEEKRRLYEICREAFLDAGYLEIGMDHFALPTDSLCQAAGNGTLHRNFMGYTDYHTGVLLGLGASAISESPGCYHQNEKDISKYPAAVNRRAIPTMRGHTMTEEDKMARAQILSLMTKFYVDIGSSSQKECIENALAEMIQDGLVEISDYRLTLTAKGRPFLRNACMAFDERMKRREPQRQIFSKTV